MFDYDREAPLEVNQTPEQTVHGVEVYNISFNGWGGSRVSAYLVPSARGEGCPAVIFQHGSAQDYTAFLSEAVSLAKKGTTSLLVDVPAVRSQLNFTRPELDRDMFTGTVVNLRRGVDLLSARPEVDDARIGFVGLSFGGYVGGILASVEKRIRAFVLMAAVPSLTEVWRFSRLPFAVEMRASLDEEQMERYLQITAPFDPINHIGSAAPAALFFQYARHDEAVPADAAWRFYGAGSDPKLIKWYDSSHQLLGCHPEGRLDRAEWLSEQMAAAPVKH